MANKSRQPVVEPDFAEAVVVAGDGAEPPIVSPASYSLIGTAKLNNFDPQAWLADVLARIAAHPAQRLDELLPWNWKPAKRPLQSAAA